MYQRLKALSLYTPKHMGALGFCAAGTHLLSICMCVCRYIIRIHKVKKLDVCLPNVYKYTRKCVHIYIYIYVKTAW